MAEDTDLEAELDALLSETSNQCRYARIVSADIKALIRKRHEQTDSDGKPLNAWKAFSQLCRRHGFDISEDMLRSHFNNGHADER